MKPLPILAAAVVFCANALSADENIKPSTEQVHSTSDQIRNYYGQLSEEEQNSIRVIMRNMGKTPNIALLIGKKGEMDKAKGFVVNVHPLRYLKEIFSSEDTKAWMKSIRETDTLWKVFINGFWSDTGIRQSFEKEFALGNVTDGQLLDFTSFVGLNHTLVLSAYSSQQWEEFIHLLVKHIPRKGNTKKYDM